MKELVFTVSVFVPDNCERLVTYRTVANGVAEAVERLGSYSVKVGHKTADGLVIYHIMAEKGWIRRDVTPQAASAQDPVLDQPLKEVKSGLPDDVIQGR